MLIMFEKCASQATTKVQISIDSHFSVCARDSELKANIRRKYLTTLVSNKFKRLTFSARYAHRQANVCDLQSRCIVSTISSDTNYIPDS